MVYAFNCRQQLILHWLLYCEKQILTYVGMQYIASLTSLWLTMEVQSKQLPINGAINATLVGMLRFICRPPRALRGAITYTCIYIFFEGIMILSNPAHPIQQEYVWRELLKVFLKLFSCIAVLYLTEIVFTLTQGMAELECNHDILAGLHDGLEFAKHIQVNFHQPITTKKVLSLITATLRPFNHLT